MLAAGVLVLVESFLRFVFVGRGTPAPVAPPEGLVVSGFYRYTRNPMYLAVVSAIVGQALLFGSSNLLAYAVLIWLLVSGFVIVYEEPVLRRKFGRSVRRISRKRAAMVAALEPLARLIPELTKIRMAGWQIENVDCRLNTQISHAIFMLHSDNILPIFQSANLPMQKDPEAV